VTDEALEAVGADAMAGNYTLAACTGLSVCVSRLQDGLRNIVGPKAGMS